MGGRRSNLSPAQGRLHVENDGVKDEAMRGIAALIAGEDAAWNNGDAAGFAENAVPDVIFTNVIGMFSVGKAPFVAQHERIFTTIYAGSTIHQQMVNVKLIRPDVAIVDTLAIVTGFKEAPPGVQPAGGAIHARLEQVLVRDSEGWWVASFHNVAVHPDALPAAPSSVA